MNAKPTNPLPNAMTDADLDRALRSENDSILPSSGFAAAVMAAVEREAAVPAPIAFPWKRAIPGLVAVAAAVVLLIAAIASVLHSPASTHRLLPALPASQSITASLAHGNDALWIGIAFAIPLACVLFCRKLIFPR